MPRASALPPEFRCIPDSQQTTFRATSGSDRRPVDPIAGSTEPPATGFRLTALATEATHRVTSVAPFILLTNIGDQNLRALHLDFEGSDQCVFCVNDNVFRFPLKFKANRELHLRALRFQCSKNSTIQLGGASHDNGAILEVATYRRSGFDRRGAKIGAAAWIWRQIPIEMFGPRPCEEWRQTRVHCTR